jgi:hypothetical protein
MLVLGTKKITRLNRFAMRAEINLVHLFHDPIEARVFLIFEQVV